MSLSGLWIVLVGLVTFDSLIGSVTGASAAVESGLMNLLFLVYIPPCIVFRLYDLPTGVGHWMISAGVHMFLSGSSCTTTLWDWSSLGTTLVFLLYSCACICSSVHDLSTTLWESCWYYTGR